MNEDKQAEYSLHFEEAALRDIKKLTKSAQIQVITLAESLKKDPRPVGAEQLSGLKVFIASERATIELCTPSKTVS